MRMSESVEWALHCCVSLGWLEDDAPIATAKLAAQFELPPAYLNKCLQALVRAEILASTPGVRGGFTLARHPKRITLLDVVMAIEGREETFRCTEIRQRGAGAATPAREFRKPCAIAVAMHRAEEAWRQELRSQTVADLMASAPPNVARQTRCWYEKFESRNA